MVWNIRGARFVWLAAIAMLGPAAAQTVPKFQVDPSWPQTLPGNWIIGTIGGILAVEHVVHFLVLDLVGRMASGNGEENGVRLQGRQFVLHADVVDGIEDVAASAYVLRKARERGVGQELPF